MVVLIVLFLCCSGTCYTLCCVVSDAPYLAVAAALSRYDTQLDAQNDYSYMDTPLRNDTVNVDQSSKVCEQQRTWFVLMQCLQAYLC